LQRIPQFKMANEKYQMPNIKSVSVAELTLMNDIMFRQLTTTMFDQQALHLRPQDTRANLFAD